MCGEHVVVCRRLAAQAALVGDVRLDRRPIDAVVVGEATLREDDERRDQLLGHRRDLHLLDRVPQRFERRGGCARGGAAVRVGGYPERRLGHQADAQPTTRRARLLGERALRRGGVVPRLRV